MHGLNTALSAMRASQVGLAVASDNLANANTPGYHRRSLLLTESQPLRLRNQYVGAGVEVEGVRRIRNSIIEGSLTRTVSDRAELAAEIETLRTIESLLTPSNGSIHDHLQLFFSGLQDLSARPDDSSVRSVLVERTRQLADSFNALGSEFDSVRSELDFQIEATIEEVNAIADEISQVQKQIPIAERDGVKSNPLRDRHDALVNQLAELVDAVPELSNELHQVVRFGQGVVHIGERAPDLKGEIDGDGKYVVTVENFEEPLVFSGGRLAGLLSARNQFLDQFETAIDTLARDVMQAFDSIHSTGVAHNGTFATLNGRRPVSDIELPLAEAQPEFPLQDGDLYVAIVSEATGERTVHRVAVDPKYDTLVDVADALSGVNHLRASIDESAGTISLHAETGYRFDFTSVPATHAETSAITGSAIPVFDGIYRGTANEQLSFVATGSGTIGSSEDLILEVRTTDGEIVAELNVGRGYEAGEPIEVSEALTIAFDEGDLNAGDSFTVAAIADPDPVGLLTALGLNTLFEGGDAHDIRISTDLVGDPDRLALTTFGNAGDSTNLQRMLRLRDEPVADNGSRTIEEVLIDITSSIGVQLNQTEILSESVSLTEQRLQTERDAVSGVDPNEELVNMLQYQRQFQAAARYISTIDEALSELFLAIR